jgi:hypothetical protein
MSGSLVVALWYLVKKKTDIQVGSLKKEKAAQKCIYQTIK